MSRKRSRIAQGDSIGAYADVLNVNNRGVALNVDRRSGPRLGVPRRTLRVGIRVMF